MLLGHSFQSAVIDYVDEEGEVWHVEYISAFWATFYDLHSQLQTVLVETSAGEKKLLVLTPKYFFFKA